MANTDIFNNYIGYHAPLGFNPNWNYGSPRKTAANYGTQRPRFGPWSTRAVSGAGYSFDLTFVDRPIQQVHYIRNFYEQFQSGFFTLIDYDNGAREHVGRFTTYSDDTQTANMKYTIKVAFEEIPNCPMRNYPGDWINSAHWINVLDDFGNQRVSTYTTGVAQWAILTPGPVSLGSPSQVARGQQMFLNVPKVGDFAQVEYIGWGFRMIFPQAANLGICSLFVDNIPLLTSLDLSSSAYVRNNNATVVPILEADNGSLLIQATNLPLGRHRVKLVAAATMGGESNSSGVIFPSIQVMH